jgi:hypothetical protein
MMQIKPLPLIKKVNYTAMLFVIDVTNSLVYNALGIKGKLDDITL